MDDEQSGTVYRVVSDRTPPMKWGDFATEAEAIEQKARLVRDGWADWDLSIERVVGPVTRSTFEMR